MCIRDRYQRRVRGKDEMPEITTVNRPGVGSGVQMHSVSYTPSGKAVPKGSEAHHGIIVVMLRVEQSDSTGAVEERPIAVFPSDKAATHKLDLRFVYEGATIYAIAKGGAGAAGAGRVTVSGASMA
eukprot:TRINITY_DN43542_c0_g1_i1.p1 TRINITY_DN43542_c0_g1~~TRINITY_DN43542_c0_g1_i1.p1  ORF type:complete len:126 (-),score=43.25 TRINITY_DN43542_c0_g1_i1:28-405(-)